MDAHGDALGRPKMIKGFQSSDETSEKVRVQAIVLQIQRYVFNWTFRYCSTSLSFWYSSSRDRCHVQPWLQGERVLMDCMGKEHFEKAQELQVAEMSLAYKQADSHKVAWFTQVLGKCERRMTRRHKQHRKENMAYKLQSTTYNCVQIVNWQARKGMVASCCTNGLNIRPPRAAVQAQRKTSLEDLDGSTCQHKWRCQIHLGKVFQTCFLLPYGTFLMTEKLEDALTWQKDTKRMWWTLYTFNAATFVQHELIFSMPHLQPFAAHFATRWQWSLHSPH